MFFREALGKFLVGFFRNRKCVFYYSLSPTGMMDYAYRMQNGSARWILYNRMFHGLLNIIMIYFLFKICLGVYAISVGTSNEIYLKEDPLGYYVFFKVYSKQLGITLSKVPLIWIVPIVDFVEVFYLPEVIGLRFEDLHRFSIVLLSKNHQSKALFWSTVRHFRFQYDPYIDMEYKVRLMRFSMLIENSSKLIFKGVYAFNVGIYLSVSLFIALRTSFCFLMKLKILVEFLLGYIMIFSTCLMSEHLLMQFAILACAKTTCSVIENRKLATCKSNIRQQIARLHRQYVFYLAEAEVTNRGVISKLYTGVILVNIFYNVNGIATLILKPEVYLVDVYSCSMLAAQFYIALTGAVIIKESGKSLNCCSSWVRSQIPRLTGSCNRNLTGSLKLAHFFEMIHHRKPFRYNLGIFGLITSMNIARALMCYSANILSACKQ